MIKKFEGEDVISNLELAYKINEIIDSVNKIQEFIEAKDKDWNYKREED